MKSMTPYKVTVSFILGTTHETHILTFESKTRISRKIYLTKEKSLLLFLVNNLVILSSSRYGPNFSITQ